MRQAARHHRLHRPITWTDRYVRQAVAADFCCALAANFLGLLARFGTGGVPAGPTTALAFGIPVGWLAWLALSGGYDTRFFGTGPDEYRRIFNAGVSLIAAVAIISYATKAEIARGYVALTLPLLAVLNLIVRHRLRRRLHRRWALGRSMRRVVVAGHGDAAAGLIRELRRAGHHGLEVVAATLPDGHGHRLRHEDVPAYEGLDRIAEIVRMTQADSVAVLSCPELDGVALRRLAWDLERTQTDLFVAPAVVDIAGPRTTIRPIAGLPLLHLGHPELFSGLRPTAKAIFDRVVAALALVLLTPIMLPLAALIRSTSSGPALFVQERIGRDGVPFRMFKFRTMVTGAEHLHDELADLEDADGVLFKLKNDPRVTRIGGRLRRWSLDELPQLINVVRGDMSLVGPRPPLRREVERYEADVFRRLVVKPGLTGLWQVSGRSDLSWEESVRLDLHYAENWSLVLDMQILWRTANAVLRRSGAY
ncbi:sugar transferase [Thermomonospora umbrina]|uniref:sugar transferase n=1 Tax=Thermomonospora umbrina TaxID=111806 RepID=UPI001FEA3C9C|nr:sugar transferase [Thermomonospora umbrina]